MEIDDKSYLIFYILSCSGFQSRLFHIHWYCPNRNFKRSSWWRHKLAHIKYLIQAYNISVLILYSKIYDKIYSPSNSFYTILWWCLILAVYAILYLIVNIYTIAWNKFLNNAFNKKITKTPIYMSVNLLEAVLVQLLLACALALMCTLQLCLHVYALWAGNCASILHIQVEHILGDGKRSPNWK